MKKGGKKAPVRSKELMYEKVVMPDGAEFEYVRRRGTEPDQEDGGENIELDNVLESEDYFDAHEGLGLIQHTKREIESSKAAAQHIAKNLHASRKPTHVLGSGNKRFVMQKNLGGKKKRAKQIENSVEHDLKLFKDLKNEAPKTVSLNRIKADDNIGGFSRNYNYMDLMSGKISTEVLNYMIVTSKDVFKFYTTWGSIQRSALNGQRLEIKLKDLKSHILDSSACIAEVRFVMGKKFAGNRIILTAKFNDSSAEEQRQTAKEYGKMDLTKPLTGEEIMGICVDFMKAKIEFTTSQDICTCNSVIMLHDMPYKKSKAKLQFDTISDFYT
jgi:hypothetical protein